MEQKKLILIVVAIICFYFFFGMSSPCTLKLSDTLSIPFPCMGTLTTPKEETGTTGTTGQLIAKCRNGVDGLLVARHAVLVNKLTREQLFNNQEMGD